MRVKPSPFEKDYANRYQLIMTRTKKVKKIFLPFTHQDLELKNGLLQYARDLKAKEGFENQLASAFIYASFTEYLGDNLLEHLRYFVHKGSYTQYGGILFVDETNKGDQLTLGQIIFKLKKFSFPDKIGIIELFEEICTARNKIFHNFANADATSLERMATVDLTTIQNKTEELLDKINIVYGGLQQILLPQPESMDSNPQAKETKEHEG